MAAHDSFAKIRPTQQCRRVSTDCEKATARTNRDGGVKSPGNPRIPELCPNCASLTPPTSIGGTFVVKRGVT